MAVLNKPRILFLTAYSIEAASDRYRIYQFLPSLEEAGFSCEVRPFATRALFRAIQSDSMVGQLVHTPYSCVRRFLDLARLSQYDLVVINREAFPLLMPLVEKIVLRKHPRVVFNFDDAIHIGHRDTPHWQYSRIYRLKYGWGVDEVLRNATHILAGSEVLASYARTLNEKVTVMPTVVDLGHYSYTPPVAKPVLTIGWVGSRSTSPYLLDIEDALRALAQKNPGKIRFLFYGDPKRSLRLPNCESLPFRLATEVEDLRRIDIGLMPMPDNEWTRGKCSFKAIQYMAMGIPAVVSPVGMAMQLVRPEVNGLWASTGEQWLSGLDRLVNDASLRARLAAEGRKTIERHYSLQVWAPEFVSLLRSVLEGPALELKKSAAKVTSPADPIGKASC